MIETIMAVAMPFIVKSLTQFIKGVGPIPMLGYRVLIVRAIVAILSLLGAVGTILVGDMSGGDIDPGLIETAVLAVVNAGIATWLYMRGTKA